MELEEIEKIEKRLGDYLVDGLVQEIHFADQARAVAFVLRDHIRQLEEKGFADLALSMQAAYSDRETISITKMFDKDTRTRSVYSILELIKELIEKHASDWRLRSPERLRSVLIGAGSDAAKVEAMDDATLVREIVSHYEATLPHPKNVEACELSRSLKKLLEARNRVLVHSEADVPADRSRATWDEAESLVDCAKEFAATIAWAFRSLNLDLPGGRYQLTDSSRTMARDLERLLGMAGLIGDSNTPG